MMTAANLLRTAISALQHTLAPAVADLVVRRGRAQPATGSSTATPPPEEDRRQAQLTLTFLDHERQTRTIQTMVTSWEQPWARPRVRQALEAAMSTPAFLRLAAEVAGPLTAGVLPRVVELLADEVAEQERKDFDRWLFDQQRMLQERLAKGNRDLQVELALYQRESLLNSVEAGKLLENWPLTLVPSQILASHTGDGPLPLRIFLSPPELAFDRFATTTRGLGNLEGPLTEGLREFLQAHYPRPGPQPAEYLAGAWDSKRFHSEASIRALFGMLRSEPTLILESALDGDTLSLRVAYWGLGQDAPAYHTLVARLPLEGILIESAKRRAQQWQATRDRLLALGRTPEEADRLGGERAFNLRLVEEEAELERAGIDTRQLTQRYQIGGEDVATLAQVLTLAHCLVAGWVLDVHHLVHSDVPPRLPFFLPEMNEAVRDPTVVSALVVAYQGVYAALGRERSTWLPSAVLDLAAQFTGLPDTSHARQLGEEALRIWLGQRATPLGDGINLLAAIDPLLRPEDRPFVEQLGRHYTALGDVVRTAQVRGFLQRIPTLAVAFASCTGDGGIVTFTADGQTLIDATNDGAILVWDLTSGARRWSMTDAVKPSVQFLVSGDGRTLVSRARGADRLLQVWDLTTGTLRLTTEVPLLGSRGMLLAFLPILGESVENRPLSPDGRTLLMPSEERILRVDLESGALRPALDGHDREVIRAGFSPDGRSILSADQAGTIKVWDASSGALRHTLTGHRGAVRALALAPDGETLASGSEDTTVRLWDLATGTLLRMFEGHTGEIRKVQISGDGQSLVSFVTQGGISVWDVPSGALRHRLTDSTFLGLTVIRSDGRTFLAPGRDVMVWDLFTGELRATVATHLADQSQLVTLSPDGSAFVTQPVPLLNEGIDRTLRIWQLPH